MGALISRILTYAHIESKSNPSKSKVMFLSSGFDKYTQSNNGFWGSCNSSYMELQIPANKHLVNERQCMKIDCCILIILTNLVG